MGFRDYFNNNLDDDDEELERELKQEDEEYYDQISFEWEGKKYTSVKKLRRELSLPDLKKVMNAYDLSIIKSEKLLKKSKIKGFAFLGLFALGLGLAFLKAPTGIVKNICEVFSKASMILGVAGGLYQSKKYFDEDDNYDKLFYVFEELDEEIMLREGEIEYQKQIDEIFPL